MASTFAAAAWEITSHTAAIWRRCYRTWQSDLPSEMALDAEVHLLICDISRWLEMGGGSDAELAAYLRPGREGWGELGRLAREELI